MNPHSFNSAVVIDGVTYPITIHQKTKNSWSVTGDFKGRHLSADGRSEREAIENWKINAYQSEDYR